MFEKHKQPSLESGIMIILIIMSMFSAVLFTSDNKLVRVTGMAVEEQGLRKVTGMASADTYEEGKPYKRTTYQLQQELDGATPAKIDEDGWRYFKVKDKPNYFVIKANDAKLYYTDYFLKDVKVDLGGIYEETRVKRIRPVYLKDYGKDEHPVSIYASYPDYDFNTPDYIQSKQGGELSIIDSRISELGNTIDFIESKKVDLPDGIESKLGEYKNELKILKEQRSEVYKWGKKDFDKSPSELQEDIQDLISLGKLLDDPSIRMENELEITRLQGILNYKNNPSFQYPNGREIDRDIEGWQYELTWDQREVYDENEGDIKEVRKGVNGKMILIYKDDKIKTYDTSGERDLRSADWVQSLPKETQNLLTTEFLTKVNEVASDLNADPDDLLQIIRFETAGSFDPKKKSGTSTATGLIQFTPAALDSLSEYDPTLVMKINEQLGTSGKLDINKIAKLNSVEQMDIVQSYFEMNGKKYGYDGKKEWTASDLYMAVLWPAAVGKGSKYELDMNAQEYYANQGLDKDGNGRISVEEAFGKAFKVSSGYKGGGGLKYRTTGKVPTGINPLAKFKVDNDGNKYWEYDGQRWSFEGKGQKEWGLTMEDGSPFGNLRVYAENEEDAMAEFKKLGYDLEKNFPGFSLKQYEPEAAADKLYKYHVLMEDNEGNTILVPVNGETAEEATANANKLESAGSKWKLKSGVILEGYAPEDLGIEELDMGKLKIMGKTKDGKLVVEYLGDQLILEPSGKEGTFNSYDFLGKKFVSFDGKEVAPVVLENGAKLNVKFTSDVDGLGRVPIYIGKAGYFNAKGAELIKDKEIFEYVDTKGTKDTKDSKGNQVEVYKVYKISDDGKRAIPQDIMQLKQGENKFDVSEETYNFLNIGKEDKVKIVDNNNLEVEDANGLTKTLRKEDGLEKMEFIEVDPDTGEVIIQTNIDYNPETKSKKTTTRNLRDNSVTEIYESGDGSKLQFNYQGESLTKDNFQSGKFETVDGKSIRIKNNWIVDAMDQQTGYGTDITDALSLIRRMGGGFRDKDMNDKGWTYDSKTGELKAGDIKVWKNTPKEPAEPIVLEPTVAYTAEEVNKMETSELLKYFSNVDLQKLWADPGITPEARAEIVSDKINEQNNKINEQRRKEREASFINTKTPTGDSIENRFIGTQGDTLYAETDTGYAYWKGDRVVRKGIPVVDEDGNVHVENARLAIEEFTQETMIGGFKVRPGDYVSNEIAAGDGKLIYQNGRLSGVLVGEGEQAKGYAVEDFFDDEGNWEPPAGVTEDNSDEAKFIKDKYKGWGAGSIFGVRLRSAAKGARAGRKVSTLFGCDDSKNCAGWRETMDSFFVDNVLGTTISGRWEESACHLAGKIPKDSSAGVNVLNFRMPGDVVRVGAHVEGHKSIIEYPNGTKQYLYKITFGIENPQFADKRTERKYEFNLHLYKNNREITTVFKKDQEVGVGAIIKRTGAQAIVQYSEKDYDKICLYFDRDVLTATQKRTDHVCNKIPTITPEATPYGEEGEGEEKEEEKGALKDF